MLNSALCETALCKDRAEQQWTCDRDRYSREQGTGGCSLPGFVLPPCPSQLGERHGAILISGEMRALYSQNGEIEVSNATPPQDYQPSSRQDFAALCARLGSACPTRPHSCQPLGDDHGVFKRQRRMLRHCGKAGVGSRLSAPPGLRSGRILRQPRLPAVRHSAKLTTAVLAGTVLKSTIFSFALSLAHPLPQIPANETHVGAHD